MRKIMIISTLLSIIITGCFRENPDYIFYYDTIITDNPVNLKGINTEHDDYNSDLPYLAATMPIIFSSNRNSLGLDFDFVYKIIEISYHEKDSILNFSFPQPVITTIITKLLQLINTPSDQLGPFNYFELPYDYFFYADNAEGIFNINFVYTSRSEGSYIGEQEIIGPVSATSINSEFDDFYPTIDPSSNTIYFSSNRDDDTYSIYKLNNTSKRPLYEFLEGPISTLIEKDEVLSSISNDKCPYITSNVMVFASDREGGYGGYDLYYSLKIDSQWTEPVNFGSKINSEFDEYRPIIFSFYGIDLIIFSSNRPGGMGGFDLYGVIIDNLIEMY